MPARHNQLPGIGQLVVLLFVFFRQKTGNSPCYGVRAAHYCFAPHLSRLFQAPSQNAYYLKADRCFQRLSCVTDRKEIISF